VCIIANGSLVCFSGTCFLGLSDVLEWSSNGSDVNEQPPTWLQITTQLTRKLGSHQISSIFNT